MPLFPNWIRARVTDEEHDALTAIARVKGQSASEILRVFIRTEARRLGVWRSGSNGKRSGERAASNSQARP